MSSSQTPIHAPRHPHPSSITPARKHRKLLKDGSGTEVWPESVEQVFVAGLKAYWDSPWATYSSGRSRWRNQFLVDYLKSNGIERSKKQVASHLQVLRNMWKGEPEFHLVAGAEDWQKIKFEDDTSSVSSGGSQTFSSPNSTLSDLSSPPSSLQSSPLYDNVRPLQPSIRATEFSLSAPGMSDFQIKLDGLMPPCSPPTPTPAAVLKLRLISPTYPLYDPSSYTYPMGFSPSITLSSCSPTFSTTANCMTKSYSTSNVKLTEQFATLDLVEIVLGMPVFRLPESELLGIDTGAKTVTQEVSVDGETVMYLVYEIEHVHPSTACAAVKLVKYQRYQAPSSPSYSQPTSPTSPSHSSNTVYQPYSPPPSSSPTGGGSSGYATPISPPRGGEASIPPPLRSSYTSPMTTYGRIPQSTSYPQFPNVPMSPASSHSSSQSYSNTFASTAYAGRQSLSRQPPTLAGHHHHHRSQSLSQVALPPNGMLEGLYS